MGKFKKGIIIAIVCMVCVAIVACTNNNNEEEDIGTEENTETVDSTYNDYSDDSNEDTEDETETDDIDDEDYDYSEDEEEDEHETETTSDTLESKLEEIADEVAMDVDANDYKVTYQYEPENNTGYIFITWLGANDASKSDVKTMLEVSGFKDVMQEIANDTAEELQEVSKTKDIRGCVILREMSNKQLEDCYNE